MNTNTNKFKNNVWNYLADCCDIEGDNKQEDTAIYLANKLIDEGFQINQASICDHFQGLGINIDFTYCTIIKTTNELHENVEPMTSKQEDKAIENWFNFIAFKALQLINKYCTHELSRDGNCLYLAGGCACEYKLQSIQSFSRDWAEKHEGYLIKSI